MAQATFKLTFFEPDTSEETIIVALVSALIFFLFVALTFVLIRTLLRLYAERKTGMLGSKFRSHMVLGALLLSLGPVIFLFPLLVWTAEPLASRSGSRGLTEDVQYHTNLIASLLTQYAITNAQDEAQRIAATPAAQKSFQTGNFSFIIDEFRNSEVTLQGGFAFALVDDRAEASFHAPEGWPLMRTASSARGRRPAPPKPFDILGETYVLGRAHVGDHGQILVAMPLPANYSGTLQRSRKQPGAISRLAAAAAAAAPHLSGTAFAADCRCALRFDLAGALSLEDGDAAAGGAGRSHARDLAWAARLSRRCSGGQ